MILGLSKLAIAILIMAFVYCAVVIYLAIKAEYPNNDQNNN